jgi:hypothetical protein
MSEEPKWKRFEKLVASIQQQLSPQADVLANVRMPGKLSGTARQLDIVVRQSIGQFELFIVIECKDSSRPVDVKTVEEFLGAPLQTRERPFSAQGRRFRGGEACTGGGLRREQGRGEGSNRAETAV